MITEDYVSFETAKLLKEKGFNILCYGYYRKDNPNDIVEKACGANWNDETYFTSRPTLQMAMKWLREVHNVFIDITTRFSLNADRDINFSYNCHKLVDTYKGEFTVGDGEWYEYEKCCDAAIKYCLENLIKL